jgi:hypothetical protein
VPRAARLDSSHPPISSGSNRTVANDLRGREGASIPIDRAKKPAFYHPIVLHVDTIGQSCLAVLRWSDAPPIDGPRRPARSGGITTNLATIGGTAAALPPSWALRVDAFRAACWVPVVVAGIGVLAALWLPAGDASIIESLAAGEGAEG